MSSLRSGNGAAERPPELMTCKECGTGYTIRKLTVETVEMDEEFEDEKGETMVSEGEGEVCFRHSL